MIVRVTDAAYVLKAVIGRSGKAVRSNASAAAVSGRIATAMTVEMIVRAAKAGATSRIATAASRVSGSIRKNAAGRPIRIHPSPSSPR